MERADKYICSKTGISRKEIRDIFKNGKIIINGIVIKDPAFKVNPAQDCVLADGIKLSYRDKTYIMLNKPDGYVCSTRDGRSETVISLVPQQMYNKDLFPAGRLDKDSRGFVFITDDGDLAHRMLSPKKHVAKYYLVRLASDYKESYESFFEEGIRIGEDEICLPARVRGMPGQPRYAFVELYEGKFHQVKRMFESVENSVEMLFRTQIGNLSIDVELGVGECLEMLHKDVENLTTSSDFFESFERTKEKFWAYLINNKL
ncbi:MAG: pseudouridine synthase [Oscillospiraceae bacterium]|nr:pseudouridine synthase [Oscillospiraceae bacterium]